MHSGQASVEAPNGKIFISYRYPINEYKNSTDSGRTWGDATQDQWQKLNTNWVMNGMECSDNGTLIRAYFNRAQVNGAVRLSYDNGSTWTDPIYTGWEETVTDIKKMSNGYIYVADTHSSQTEKDIWRSIDNGSSWQMVERWDYSNNNCAYGEFFELENHSIVWYATKQNTNSMFRKFSHDNGTTWTDMEEVSFGIDNSIHDPEGAQTGDMYFLWGRNTIDNGDIGDLFLYSSTDGLVWGDATKIADTDGYQTHYSNGCVINKYDDTTRNEILIDFGHVPQPETHCRDDIYCRIITNISGTELTDDDITFLSINGQGNESVNQNSTLTINWTIIENTSQYHLEIDNNSDFSSPEFNYTDINEANYPTNFYINETRVSFIAPSSLENYSYYYYRVRAYSI